MQGTRHRQTDAEKVLWMHLRSRRFSGFKFLRQHPISVKSLFGRNLYYIPDFYCSKAKLIIEADGPIHLLKEDYDNNRDEVLKALNLKIIRFTNEEIFNNTLEVLNKIDAHLK